MSTAFQARQNAQYREIVAKQNDFVRSLGFVDVIVTSPNKHGQGKAGHSCTIGAHKTVQSGVSIQDFARRVFGKGLLRRIDDETVQKIGYQPGALCCGVILDGGAA